MSIELENVSYIYMKGSPFEKRALDGINLQIPQGQMVGIIGHTGSGKSTLIQHFNGLILPQEGKVRIDGMDTTEKRLRKEIRRRVGMVFQFPEYQLFEETVRQDVAFGPNNLGYGEKKVEALVKEALMLVGLDESYLERSPFDLSGGQKRRVAIAGVIAMNPSVLVLDEPTAGLDPAGSHEIMSFLKKLHKEKGITVIIISHSMEEVALVVDRTIVMEKGKIVRDGGVGEVFRDEEYLRGIGLSVPGITLLIRELHKTFPEIKSDIYTVKDARTEILRILKNRQKGGDAL